MQFTKYSNWTQNSPIIYQQKERKGSTWNGLIPMSIVLRRIGRGSWGLERSGRRYRRRQADDGRLRRRIGGDALEGAVLRVNLLMLNVMMLGGDDSVFVFLAHIVRSWKTTAIYCCSLPTSLDQIILICVGIVNSIQFLIAKLISFFVFIYKNIYLFS